MSENFREMMLSERIQWLLTSLNKTQTQIAKEIGISKNAMSNYINGNRTPDTMTCLNLSRTLGVTMEWLLVGENGTGKNPDIISTSIDSDELTEEEKLLVKNYRVLHDNEKDEIQGRTARMAVKSGNKKLLTSSNTKNDSEYGNELSDIG